LPQLEILRADHQHQPAGADQGRGSSITTVTKVSSADTENQVGVAQEVDTVRQEKRSGVCDSEKAAACELRSRTNHRVDQSATTRPARRIVFETAPCRASGEELPFGALAVRPTCTKSADQGLQARQISASRGRQGALGGVEPAVGAAPRPARSSRPVDGQGRGG